MGLRRMLGCASHKTKGGGFAADSPVARKKEACAIIDSDSTSVGSSSRLADETLSNLSGLETLDSEDARLFSVVHGMVAAYDARPVSRAFTKDLRLALDKLRVVILAFVECQVTSGERVSWLESALHDVLNVFRAMHVEAADLERIRPELAVLANTTALELWRSPPGRANMEKTSQKVLISFREERWEEHGQAMRLFLLSLASSSAFSDSVSLPVASSEGRVAGFDGLELLEHVLDLNMQRVLGLMAPQLPNFNFAGLLTWNSCLTPPVENQEVRFGQSGSNVFLQRMEELHQDHFRAYDLHGNELIQEDEFVKLHEKMVLLDRGTLVDRGVIGMEHSKLFRSSFGSDGAPINFVAFRKYWAAELARIDGDPAAQEMILEQLVIRAQCARAAFKCISLSDESDILFLQAPEH